MTDRRSKGIAMYADQFGIPILMAEYRDNPADSTSATLEQQIEAWGLTPYVTNVQWNIQGRGLHIVPPW